MANARRAWSMMTTAPLPKPGAWRIVRTLEEAADGADFIQESLPEREDLKIRLLAQAETAMRPDVVIGSSTSGLLPSRLQSGLKHPERFVVGHPFNPVYLMPLVEICGGALTSEDDQAAGGCVLSQHRHAPAARAQGDRRLHRRPADGGAVARGAVAGQRRHRDGRGNRRRDALRPRPALGVHGHDADLPHRRRRAGHAAFHGAVRAEPEMAVDEADGRAGTGRRAAGQAGGAIRRAGGGRRHPRLRAAARFVPGVDHPGAEDERLRGRPHAGGV